MTSTSSLRRLVLLLVIVPAALGCDQVAERVVDEAGAGGVEVEADDEGVTLRGGDGGTITTGRGLPELLPDELPLPEDLEVVASVSQDDGGQVVVGLQAFASGSYADLTGFFERRLPATGWTVLETTRNDLGSVRGTIWVIEGHGFSGTVTATELGEGDPDAAGPGGAQLSVAVSLEST